MDLRQPRGQQQSVILPQPTIKVVESPAPRVEWWRLIHSDENALLEQGPAWVDALAAAGTWQDCSRYYEFDDGRSFVLPLARRVGHALAPQSGFSPAWGIGGLVGPDADEGILREVSKDLSELKALWVHVRPSPTQAQLWSNISESDARQLPRRAHVIDLSGTPDEVFARFSSSGRRNVRRATKLGVTTKSFTRGVELETYYHELFLPSVLRWAKKQGEPSALATVRARYRDPLRKLTSLATSLGDSFRLTMAYVDGEPAAGNIVLEGPNAHYTRGAMNHRAAKTDAVYLGLWVAIEHACLRGDKWFHMGESGDSQTISAYKERFGATAYDYHEYRYERVPSVAIDTHARNLAKRIIGFDRAE